MLQYLQAENLKCRRTFVKKLIFLGPAVALMLGTMGGSWFQCNSFNAWYEMMLPGCIALMAALVNQNEDKKMGYRAVFALPVSLKKVWMSKVLVIAAYVFLACMVLALGVISGGCVFSVKVPGFRAVAAAVIIAVSALWQVPLCLFLSKKLGIMGAVLMNGGIGVVLNIFAATKSIWWVCPYSWTSRLMCPVLGILPSGLLAEPGDPLMNSGVVAVGMVLSVVLFVQLVIVTAHWFEKQEVI